MNQKFAPRVLVAAYQCGPGMGSVSQIGWEWYSRLSEKVPTTLVTHVRNREALARAGAPVDTPAIVLVDTEWFAGPLYRLAKKIFRKSEHAVFLISSLDFFVYDRAALKILKKRKAAGERWDIVHAVTPVSTVAPTRLHRLGCPVVLGPLNAGLGDPKGFSSILKADSTWLYPVRHLGRLIDALIGSTRNAAAILTATRATIKSIPGRYRDRCRPMIENGVELSRFQSAAWPEPPSRDKPLKVCFVGRLVPMKALPLLLKAVAEVRDEFPVELTVVGDGPMAGEWRQAADQLNLNGSVKLLGAESLDRVADRMRDAHVFCLPSVRESGGAVLLEALACSRPVIAVAFGGPAEIVDDLVGRAVPPESPEAVAHGIADALRDIVRNPERWKQRGVEGRRRAEERYGWDTKVRAAIELYRQVLHK